MIITKPDYYNEFVCIADKCTDTCCAGWQIVIDEETLEKYENDNSTYKDAILKNVDFEQGCFKQDDCKRCAFLNEKNLCDLILNTSKDSLCHTCKTYPRHIEEFENIREYNLSISCPEVARIILENTKKVNYESTEDDLSEEFEDFDVFLHSYLEDAREIIKEILQNRVLNLEVRLKLINDLAAKIQEKIEDGDTFSISQIFETYNDKEKFNVLVKESISYIEKRENDERFYYDTSKSIFSRLYELERLYDDWEDELDYCWDKLFTERKAGYNKIKLEFEKKFEIENNPGTYLEIILEQFAIYFTYTYFCGAVYDDMVLSKMEMMIKSVHIIHDMIMAHWSENEKISMGEIEKIVYRFSRELEHSDENLLLFEDIVIDLR